MRKLYGRFLSIAVSSAMLFSFSAISIFADTPADISQDAVVTGSINSSANTFTETDTVSVDTSINRPVNSGDFVSYRFDNLAMGNLANRDITLRGTNTVIGKIIVTDAGVNQADKQITGSDNDKEDAVPGSRVGYKFKVVFNENATGHSSLHYTFNYANAVESVATVDSPKTVVQKITVNNNVVVSNNLTIPAYVLKPYSNQGNTVKVSNSYSFVNVNHLNIQSGDHVYDALGREIPLTDAMKLNALDTSDVTFDIASDIESNDHLKVGDLLTYEITGNNAVKFNPNASEFANSIESATLHNARDVYTPLSYNPVNTHGVHKLTDLVLKVKPVSVTPTKVVLQVTEAPTSGMTRASYAYTVKDGLTIPVKTVTVKRADGSEQAYRVLDVAKLPDLTTSGRLDMLDAKSTYQTAGKSPYQETLLNQYMLYSGTLASADVIDLPDTPTPSTPSTNTQTPPTSGGSVHRTPGSNEANKIKKVALKSVPKTSDSADIIIYAGLLFASIIGLSILGVSGRKILNK